MAQGIRIAVATVLLFAGCGISDPPPPELLAVEPGRCTAGLETAISVSGRDFHPILHGNLAHPEKAKIHADFSLTLVASGQAIALTDVTLSSLQDLRATVPAQVTAGVYRLDLVDPRGRTASLDDALEVQEGNQTIVGPPCSVASDCADDPCSLTGECDSGFCVYDKDSDGDGHIDLTCGGDDCDDSCERCWSGRAETCDGFDNDCDAGTPDGLDEALFGDSCDGADGDLCEEGTLECNGVALYCTDTTNTTTEIPGDGEDQDCDGQEICYVDADGDGFRSADTVPSADLDCLDLGEAATSAALDCDDNPLGCGAGCYPGNLAADLCDGADNDCDGPVDENPEIVWYADADGDSYGDAGSTQNACTQPGGYVADNTDCADTPGIDPACNNLSGENCHPGLSGSDTCDGADNDCDTAFDEDAEIVWYADADGDTYGDAGTTQNACSQPGGYVGDSTDCADTPGSDPACNNLSGENCHPGRSGSDLCDGADNDCDTLTDEDQPCPVCGDNTQDVGEACDDGNTVGGDYCSADCQAVTGSCGDSVLQGNEECDDGDVVAGDGCDGDCAYEWWDRLWQRRRKIVFDNSGQPSMLFEFAVSFFLDDSVINYAAAGVGGESLRFVDADGISELAHEIESWVPGGVSVVWVNVPEIDGGSDTDYVWLYYDNPGASLPSNPEQTWDASFVGVWHFHQDLLDSSPMNNDGTDTGSSSAVGQLADGRGFDGLSGGVAAGSAASLDNVFAGGGTIEAWIHPTGWGQADHGRIADKAQNTGAGQGWAFQVDNGTPPYRRSLHFGRDFSGTNGHWETEIDSIALDRWQYAAIVYDDTPAAPTIYIDGQPVLVTETVQPTGSPVDDSTSSVVIGNIAATGRAFDGILDEVRISNTPRSADWVNAQYLSMSDSFVLYGNEEQL